ncbi:KpsF/GutQ family sugar-phosphate isomerase [Peijinzhouia sedimentorum]
MKLRKNIIETAKSVLQNEAEAINEASLRINGSMVSIVEEILAGSGRVVITGIGKSAIIAQKIVATLNSTGTPSLFMHAADAIHGDLGMIQEKDIVICISKSGNTPEIKVLVPLLKQRGAKLIALVSNIDSYLAKQADFIMDATIKEEACPNNLAPTTSTTLHLALGDALAVCLLESRGFTSEDFAKYHPGGALGKQLYMRVNDIYQKDQLPIVKENDSIREVIIEISTKRLGATAVLGENGILTGIITDGDLRRMLQKHLSIENLIAKDIMTENPQSIDEEEYAVRALNRMKEKNITQLVVKSEGKIAGFIHLHDLLREGIV